MAAAPTVRIVIDPRLNGPRGSANGGCACGLLARFVDGPAEVVLHRPPPLGRALDVDATRDGATLRDGADLVAQARRAAPIDLEPPLRPTLAEAAAARARHADLPIPSDFWDCFVCGRNRAGRDGLGVQAGPLASKPETGASPFVPGPDLAGADGLVAPHFLWAALDCPSHTPQMADGVTRYVSARLAADLRAPVRPGDELVVVGWPLGGEGRKRDTASAILRPDGAVVAIARALWVALRPS